VYDWSRPRIINYSDFTVEPMKCEYCGRWTEGSEKGCQGCGAPVSPRILQRQVIQSCSTTGGDIGRFTTWSGTFG
jgi:hypothetical protein